MKKNPNQLPLENLGDDLKIEYDKDLVALIVKLLEETTSLDVVSAFLKSKEEHFSAGSWAQMLTDRLTPSLTSGAITVPELIRLLAQSEEYGGSHSFLYKCSIANAKNLISETAVKAAAKKMGALSLVENPKVLDQPEEATLVDIRWDMDKRGKCLVAKVIERHFKLKPAGVETVGDQVIKKWDKKPVRAVHVVRLYASGLLEIRIQSYSITEYDKQISALWKLVADLFPPALFQELSLTKVKEQFYKQQEELKDVIRFSDSSMENDYGIVVTAATGTQQTNLFANKGAAEAVNTFMKHDGGHCETFDLWFLKQKNGLPSSDIHVLLEGKKNEFSLTASCSKDDFECVFDRIYVLV